MSMKMCILILATVSHSRFACWRFESEAQKFSHVWVTMFFTQQSNTCCLVVLLAVFSSRIAGIFVTRTGTESE